MKNNEHSKPNKHNTINRGNAIRAGALSLGILLSTAPSASASKVHNSEPAIAMPAGHEAMARGMTTEEKRISDDIGSSVPVTFRAGMAYYHAENVQPLDIVNPLWVTAEIGSGKTRKAVKFVGYIEPKGGPTGPAVVLLEYNKKTITLEPYEDNPVMPLENEVVFPATSSIGASFDTYNPVNPQTGSQYTLPGYDQPLLVGNAVPAK